MPRLAIRREILANEQRAPLCPIHLPEVIARKIEVTVQRCTARAFRAAEYEAAGARIDQDITDCDVILGLKELPADRLLERKVHAFFSHTIKGQPKNMPMLLHLMERGCTLIDYERITDEQGRRLVFFGRFAGLAGMIDTLWALGQRLSSEEIDTPLAAMDTAYRYSTIDHAWADLERIGPQLLEASLPDHLTPMIIGVTGDGNVSRGAQEVLRAIGSKPLAPADLADPPTGHGVYHVVFREGDMVEPRLGLHDPASFDLQHYYQHPGRYRGVFERYLPYLNVLVNCIYWEERYPRLVTVEGLRQLYDQYRPRLKVIGDISCDIRGAIEATLRATTPLDPVYVYDVDSGDAVEGVEGRGPVILAIYNLPSEFPRAASEAFSAALLPFIAPMTEADYSRTFEHSNLPAPLKRATIVYRGELTPDYRYLKQYL